MTAIVMAAFAVPAWAAPTAPVLLPSPDKAALAVVYAARPDLQAVFAADWTGGAAMRRAGMATLADWAARYGYKEYPDILASYAPRAMPRALVPIAGSVAPKLVDGSTFDFDTLTASSVFVVDVASRRPLMAYASSKPHPLASISKLMTAMVALDAGVPMSRVMAVTADDEVGGARLSVTKRDRLTALQLLNITLVASANNTANAFARATGLSKASFVKRMNDKAASLGLAHTSFVEPTGIEPGNVSTAEEIAALGLEAFARDPIRRATTTQRYTVTLASGRHTVKSTDGLLLDDANGLYVLGGKTGYIEESRWNLVVKLRDARMHPIEVVVLGTASQAQSFKDAATVARWTWDHYRWTR